MRGRSILSLHDLSLDEIDGLLDLTARFRDDGIPAARPGRFVCGLFFDPSLRTRTSLEISSTALGAHCIVHNVGEGVWKLETRDGAVMDGDKVEHIRDAIGHFLGGVVDCIGVRCFNDPHLLPAIRELTSVPVLSLESPLGHPMQGLADLFVLKTHIQKNDIVAITWAWHPRPLPSAVAETALRAFTRAGYRVRLVHPPGYELEGGDAAAVHHDMDEGLAGARVIYAKSWAARGAEHRDWIVDARRAGDANFMHCLPVRRNVVVTDEVIDGPRSWVAEQARARVLTQAAVLHEVMA